MSRLADLRMKHATVRGCRVLSLEGSLTVAAAADVRRVLRKLLLDSTMPVICELAGVSAFSSAGLTVFPTAFDGCGGPSLAGRRAHRGAGSRHRGFGRHR